LALVLAFPLQQTYFPTKQYSVEGQCVVLTGGSGGIGVVIADALANKGVAKVMLAARRESKLKSIVETLAAKYPKVEFASVPADIADDSARKNLHHKAMQFCGTDSVILVNNAGVEAWQHFNGPNMARHIDRTIDINVKGLMHLTREFLPGMMKDNRGHVVNIASLAGKLGGAFVNAYTTSKHAVIGFNRAMRAEMGVMQKRVTFNAVCPGFVTDVGMAKDGFASQGKEGYDALINLYGSSEAADTAAAVIRAVEYDEPEQLVNGISPIRLLVVLQEVFPRFADWVGAASPEVVNKFLLKIAARYD